MVVELFVTKLLDVTVPVVCGVVAVEDPVVSVEKEVPVCGDVVYPVVCVKGEVPDVCEYVVDPVVCVEGEVPVVCEDVVEDPVVCVDGEVPDVCDNVVDNLVVGVEDIPDVCVNPVVFVD